jgi:hypothetical protein
MPASFSLTSRPFYDSARQCYIKVIAVSPAPTGALTSITKRVTFERLSPFEQPGACERYEPCGYVLLNPNNTTEYAVLDDLAAIITWCSMNTYSVDTSITNMLNNSQVRMTFPIIAFITG